MISSLLMLPIAGKLQFYDLNRMIHLLVKSNRVVKALLWWVSDSQTGWHQIAPQIMYRNIRLLFKILKEQCIVRQYTDVYIITVTILNKKDQRERHFSLKDLFSLLMFSFRVCLVKAIRFPVAMQPKSLHRFLEVDVRCLLCRIAIYVSYR